MRTRTPLLALALLLASGCVRWGPLPADEGSSTSADGEASTEPSTEVESESGDESSGDSEFPWPEPITLDPAARVVVWGQTGIPTRNLDMFANIFSYLAGSASAGDGDGDGTTTGDGDGDPTTGDGDGDGTTTGDGDGDGTTTGDGDGDITILWLSDCDPREDALGCLAGNLDPFFAMVETLGSIEFQTLDSVDPVAYDAVVADFCGIIEPEQLEQLLVAGARVLVLGDAWCLRDGQTSAALANTTLERIGTRFNGELLYNEDFLVSDNKQVELLAGVASLDVWGLSLQEHDASVVEAVGVLRGALLTSRE